MATHQGAQSHARPGGPFLTRDERVVGIAVAIFGMLLSPAMAEAITIAGCLVLLGAAAGRAGGWKGARTTGVVGGALVLGSMPYWLVAGALIVAQYGF